MVVRNEITSNGGSIVIKLQSSVVYSNYALKERGWYQSPDFLMIMASPLLAIVRIDRSLGVLHQCEVCCSGGCIWEKLFGTSPRSEILGASNSSVNVPKKIGLRSQPAIFRLFLKK